MSQECQQQSPHHQYTLNPAQMYLKRVIQSKYLFWNCLVLLLDLVGANTFNPITNFIANLITNLIINFKPYYYITNKKYMEISIIVLLKLGTCYNRLQSMFPRSWESCFFLPKFCHLLFHVHHSWQMHVCWVHSRHICRLFVSFSSIKWTDHSLDKEEKKEWGTKSDLISDQFCSLLLDVSNS